MKTCSDCKTSKNSDDFGLDKIQGDGFRTICKSCDSSRAMRRRKIIREQVADYLKEVGKDECKVCGYNKCKAVIELHHINPEEKDAHIAVMVGKAYSLKTIKKEIDKCIALCANHHREYHAGILDLGDFIITT
jgi:hypothetical protein